jgi:hypothetical protein
MVAIARMHTTSMSSRCIIFRRLNPMQQKRAASTEAGYSALVLLSANEGVPSETVMVVATAEVDVGVTLAGLKLHHTLAGRPTQANVTAPLNPFSGVIEMVAVALFCSVTVNICERPEDVPAIVKVGCTTVTASTE